jgi:hypothetical protein
MAIWKRAGSVLGGAVAAAAVVALSAAPAMAMPATTLKAKVTGGGTISVTSVGKTTLADGAVKVSCTSSKATGTIGNGTHSGAAPLKVGTTKKLSFTNCSNALTGAVTNSVKKFPNISVDSKTTKSGDTDGIVGPVTVDVSTTGCTFQVTGSTPGYYSNSKHELFITNKLPTKASKTADLTIGDVTGCAGVVSNGQHPTFTTTYKVSKHVKITVS